MRPHGPDQGLEASKTDTAVSGRQHTWSMAEPSIPKGRKGDNIEHQPYAKACNLRLNPTVSSFFGADEVRKIMKRGHCYFKTEKFRAQNR